LAWGDPSGLGIQTDFDLTGGTDAFGAIRYDGGKLYEDTGIVRDATSGAVLGQIALPDDSSIEASPEWGSNGIAFNREGLQTLSGTLLAAVT
jgi:hypothetical protein